MTFAGLISSLDPRVSFPELADIDRAYQEIERRFSEGVRCDRNADPLTVFYSKRAFLKELSSLCYRGSRKLRRVINKLKRIGCGDSIQLGMLRDYYHKYRRAGREFYETFMHGVDYPDLEDDDVQDDDVQDDDAADNDFPRACSAPTA